MPLILDRPHVLEVYAEAAARRWVLPAFNSENLTTTEAILAGVKDHGDKLGRKDLPIIVGITNVYWHRPQSVNYTHTRDWKVGMRLFLEDLKVLTSAGSPFADLKVLVHLDHIQWDADAELLAWDMGQFSSIMFDASTRPIAENIQRTAAFVEQHRNKIVIEGACDEISEETKSASDQLTSPELAERYFKSTGVDIIVANVGTEHRARASSLRYHRDPARAITQRIGPRLCLHGTSSVAPAQVADLFEDGVCKVNLWTALERDSTPPLLREMLGNAAKVVGRDLARKWTRDKLLGETADHDSAWSLDYSTISYRQDIAFQEMKKIVTSYLELWYA